MTYKKKTPAELRAYRARSTIKHGTASRYTNCQCRCGACKKAWRIAHLKYMHRNPQQQDRHRKYMAEVHAHNRAKKVGICILEVMP